MAHCVVLLLKLVGCVVNSSKKLIPPPVLINSVRVALRIPNENNSSDSYLNTYCRCMQFTGIFSFVFGLSRDRACDTTHCLLV